MELLSQGCKLIISALQLHFMQPLLVQQERNHNQNHDNKHNRTDQTPNALVSLLQFHNLQLLALLCILRLGYRLHKVEIQPLLFQRLLFLEHHSGILLHPTLISGVQVVV